MLFFPLLLRGKKGLLRIILDSNITIYLYYWQGIQNQDKYYFTTNLWHACNISIPCSKK